MKKNILALVLAASMAFSMAGCAKKEEPAPASSASESVTVASSPAEEVVVAASSTPEEPEPEALVAEPAEETGPTNPLTGEPVETDISANRPYAIMLNSLKQALPQSGNSKADMWFEMVEEGGITRVMGIYQDINDVGTIGPIRSTRHYFLEMAIGMDAIVCHAGGASSAFDLLNWTHYTTLNALKNAGGMYYRDKGRLSAGYALEHTMYTSSENIQNWLSQNPDFRTEHEGGSSYEQTYQFADQATPETNAIDANELSVNFSDYKTTKFVYDPETQKYNVFFFGEPYVDAGAENQQVAATNVVVIKSEETTVMQDGAREWYDLVNGGTGYYISNGKCEEIDWTKGEAIYPLTLLNKDGTPLKMNRGKTYFCVCDVDRSITVDGTNINTDSTAPAVDGSTDTSGGATESSEW